jgi:hypothetical protein
MKQKNVKVLKWAVLVLPILAFSCKSDRQGRSTPGLIDDEDPSAIISRIETIKNVYHLSPSPAEMLGVIDMGGLSFDGDLLNPPENAEKYLDTKSRTLNLGVYITDMAYTALFGRHEETLDYLEIAGDMAEEIRLTGAIDEGMIENARNNVEYLDSLYNISNEAFVNMLFFCEKNNRPNTIILLSAGAFVESMHLAINLVDDFERADQIIQHLAEQKYALDNLMLFAESLKEEDANVADLIEEMQPITSLYDQIEIEAGSTTVQKDESNKLVIGGGSKPRLSREEFEALKEATSALRSQITRN